MEWSKRLLYVYQDIVLEATLHRLARGPTAAHSLFLMAHGGRVGGQVQGVSFGFERPNLAAEEYSESCRGALGVRKMASRKGVPSVLASFGD